jgi:hypothetical protein
MLFVAGSASIMFILLVDSTDYSGSLVGGRITTKAIGGVYES